VPSPNAPRAVSAQDPPIAPIKPPFSGQASPGGLPPSAFAVPRVGHTPGGGPQQLPDKNRFGRASRPAAYRLIIRGLNTEPPRGICRPRPPRRFVCRPCFPYVPTITLPTGCYVKPSIAGYRKRVVKGSSRRPAPRTQEPVLLPVPLPSAPHSFGGRNASRHHACVSDAKFVRAGLSINQPPTARPANEDVEGMLIFFLFVCFGGPPLSDHLRPWRFEMAVGDHGRKSASSSIPSVWPLQRPRSTAFRQPPAHVPKPIPIVSPIVLPQKDGMNGIPILCAVFPGVGPALFQPPHDEFVTSILSGPTPSRVECQRKFFRHSLSHLQAGYNTRTPPRPSFRLQTFTNAAGRRKQVTSTARLRPGLVDPLVLGA